MNLIAAVLLFLGLSLASFYVFPSGQPQPADFVLLGFAIIMSIMALGDEHLELSPFVVSWGLMVLWVLFVSLAWTLVMETTGFLIYPAFFFFNFLVGMATLRFLRVYGSYARSLIRIAVSIALLVTATEVMVQLALGFNRATGSFNNPNQMAYFSLCGIVVLMMLDDYRLQLRPLVLSGLAAGMVGILSASSLAAMGGGALVVVGWAMANATRIKHFARLVVAVPLFLIVVIVINLRADGQIFNNLQKRMDRAPDKVEGVYEQRKFDRLEHFPEYAILGAGEGERQRFVPYHRAEIHSSFINMLFAYGIPGFGLFLLVIFTALRRAPAYVWVGMAGPLFYSMTHNGLRSTLFWLVLVLCWHLYRWGRQPVFYPPPAAQDELVHVESSSRH
ncbi:hypothetical protein DU490_03165 [Halomonas sp. DQ26W]|uniref:O-antigen ligase family protein n=1 Tax=Halomonas sp. DQ26W TaxID=2282311 RepID=UPI000DF7F1F9|nr:hypothetical protein [Halomonas sp. DQ26W]RDB44268.1 hypothetical protein DU490_03165 [Halomonas sp. DQ26W]